jgi:Endonuclease-reverse transcriptase
MNNTNIDIFYSNVKTQNPATQAILQHVAENLPNTHIVIITEPWISTVRSDTQEKGTVHHPKWRVIAPTDIAKARTIIYTRKTSTLRFTPLLHLPYANELILPIEVSDGTRSFKLIAVYNPPKTHGATQFLTELDPITDPAIICGDLNLHSPEWDSTVTTREEHAIKFQEWFTDGAFEVHNDRDTPTFHGSHFQYKKVIDLILSNLAFQTDNCVTAINVHQDLYFGSDHYPITFTATTEMITEKPTPRLYIPAKKRDEWTREIKTLLTNISDSFPNINTKELLDEYAKQVMQAFTDATTKIGKKRSKENKHAKHWWNAELDDAIKELRFQAEAAKTTRNPYLIDKFIRTKGVYNAKIKHAKQNWVTERLAHRRVPHK